MAHKKLGYMLMSALKQTKQCVAGLKSLHNAHFPGDEYSDPVVKLGKMHHIDQPDVSDTDSSVSGPMPCIYWDMVGPMRSK